MAINFMIELEVMNICSWHVFLNDPLTRLAKNLIEFSKIAPIKGTCEIIGNSPSIAAVARNTTSSWVKSSVAVGCVVRSDTVGAKLGRNIGTGDGTLVGGEKGDCVGEVFGDNVAGIFGESDGKSTGEKLGNTSGAIIAYPVVLQA